MPEYNEVLVSLRKNLGLSQQELANKLGMTRSAISMYETGQREPDLQTFEIFADFYNVDMNTLTGHEVTSEKNKKKQSLQLEAYIKSSYTLIDNVRDLLSMPSKEHKIASPKDDDFLDCIADSQTEMEDALNQVKSYFENHLKSAPKENQDLFLKQYEAIVQQFKEGCSRLNIIETTTDSKQED